MAKIKKNLAPKSNFLSIHIRLVLASALMLFLELALIRWTGSNILHLSYFTNFVLLGSFLGIGLGFLRANKSQAFPFYSLVGLALLVTYVTFNPVTVDRQGSDIIYFTSLATTGPPAWLILPIVFLATAIIMAGPAELVGQCFQKISRLTAYRYDLIGSIIGIFVFTALSFLGTPPIVWGVLVVIVFGLLMFPNHRPKSTKKIILLIAVPVYLLLSMLFAESIHGTFRWSPYYKIALQPFSEASIHAMDIAVNGIPHQLMVPASYQMKYSPIYVLPYQRTATQPKDILIVGAGSGNDVAIALKKGAHHIDAVEIDPRLLEIGQQYHPDRPYKDARVTTYIDDGRAFLSGTTKKYDMILFALPDSLTLIQGASSLRLESYLFTEEAFQSVRTHLKPNGTFSMYNHYREIWLIDRLALTAEKTFGHKPCVDEVATGLRQAVITVGLSETSQRCNIAWAGQKSDTPPPATDDKPFLYLFSNTIPSLYLVTIGLILAVSLLAVKLVGGSYRRMSPYKDLFLLGAGFLLLETKSITTFALLFGTTWVVNAIVFAGVLLAILAAIEITRRFPTPPIRIMAVLLFVGLLLSWIIPNAWLLSLPVWLRAVTAITITFFPIFIANIIFAKRFANSKDPTAAFGANLLGAMVGGCLEYLALMIGFNGLLLVTAVLYAGAFIFIPRKAS